MENQSYKTNLLNDLLFKKIFASKETEDITLHFLREVCGIEAKSLQVKPTDVYDVTKLADIRIENDILLTKVDLLVELDGGRLVTVELQNNPHQHFTRRVQAYTSKGYLAEYSEEDAEDNKYATLKPIISVNILNFIYHKEKRATNPVVKYHVVDEEYGYILRDELTGEELVQYIFIELPKINDSSSQDLQNWLPLFLTGKATENAAQHLHRVEKLIEFENLSKEERGMIIDRQRSRDIQAAERDTQLKEARVEGREEGVEIGEKKKSREIAINLLQLGLSHEKVAKGTGLSLEEVEQIAKEL